MDRYIVREPCSVEGRDYRPGDTLEVTHAKAIEHVPEAALERVGPHMHTPRAQAPKAEEAKPASSAGGAKHAKGHINSVDRSKKAASKKRTH